MAIKFKPVDMAEKEYSIIESVEENPLKGPNAVFINRKFIIHSEIGRKQIKKDLSYCYKYFPELEKLLDMALISQKE